MAKLDSDFINVSQDYELNDWLDRNGYRETQDNRDELKKIILDLKGGESSSNLTWKKLDSSLANDQSKFSELEHKAG